MVERGASTRERREGTENPTAQHSTAQHMLPGCLICNRSHSLYHSRSRSRPLSPTPSRPLTPYPLAHSPLPSPSSSMCPPTQPSHVIADRCSSTQPTNLEERNVQTRAISSIATYSGQPAPFQLAAASALDVRMFPTFPGSRILERKKKEKLKHPPLLPRDTLRTYMYISFSCGKKTLDSRHAPDRADGCGWNI